MIQFFLNRLVETLPSTLIFYIGMWCILGVFNNLKIIKSKVLIVFGLIYWLSLTLTYNSGLGTNIMQVGFGILLIGIIIRSVIGIIAFSRFLKRKIYTS